MKKFKFLLAVATALASVSLSACEDPVYYTVTFNTLGGTEVESQTVKKNSYATRPENNPERNGYTFDDWTYHGSLFDFENTKITKDITIKAKYSAITYTITYNYSQEGNTRDNPTTYTIEDEVTLYNPSYTKEHYHLAYYQDQNGFQYNGKINKGTTGDLVLTDVWEGNIHSVSSHLDGTFEGLGNYKYGDEVHIKYTIEVPKGYVLVYLRTYFTNSCKETLYSSKEFTFTMPDENVYISLRYDPIIMFVTYELDGGTNNSNNPTTFCVDSSNKPLYEPTKDGYTFINWTLNGEIITELDVASYTDLYLSNSPRTITAHWQTN